MGMMWRMFIKIYIMRQVYISEKDYESLQELIHILQDMINFMPAAKKQLNEKIKTIEGICDRYSVRQIN